MFQQLQDLRNRRARGEGGFTLIELLVVVIIITVISAIAIPIYLGQRGKANDAKMEQDLSAIASLLSAATSTGSPVTFDEEAGVIGTASSTDAGLRSVTVDGTLAVTGFASGQVPAAGSCVAVIRVDGAEDGTCLPGEAEAPGESTPPPSQSSSPPSSSPPSAPLGVSASYVTGVGGRIDVTWSAPSSPGTSAISGYTVTVREGDTVTATVTVSNGEATSASVLPSDGINVSRTYTVTVTASNSTGAGPASDPSNSVTTPSGTIQTQTFTSNGTFTGQSGVPYDLLIVGGGGAGGKDIGGGGGGGQVAYFGGVSLVGSKSVVVGAGGQAILGTNDSRVGTNGESSSLGAYTAAGGGRGGTTCLPDSSNDGCSVNTNAVPGGGSGVANGGGANGWGWANNATAATTPGTGDGALSGGGSGNVGGSPSGWWSDSELSRAGGGAGAGGNASSRTPGAGRLVTAGLFAGNTTRYGGGGGGAGGRGMGTTAGADGGGTGAALPPGSSTDCSFSGGVWISNRTSDNGGAAMANTGSGGGGAAQGVCTRGGAGGSGIVIVKWIQWP